LQVFLVNCSDKAQEDAPLLTALQEFVLVSGPDRADTGQGILEFTDPRFWVLPGGRPRTVRRTWLDTFDWRLFRAGMTLEFVAGRGTAELVLTAGDGEQVTAEPAAGTPIRWPCRLDQLPAGPLRERLVPVLGVRALLPVARATSALTELRAVNADEKTIAVLALDRMKVARPASGAGNGAASAGTCGALPARLSVRPLRGYQAQAARLAAALALTAGVDQATESPFEAAVAATGRRPGDYTGKLDIRLTGAMPASLALGTVLGRLFDTALANLPGTIADIDTEFLHDLRVCVRRTRSVLKAAAPVLPGSLLDRYRPEFKWLGDLTTPTRDLDVYILQYPAMRQALRAATESELEPFLHFLQRRRAVAFRQLAAGLRSARFKSLAADWRADLERLNSAPPHRRHAADAFAATTIARARKRVLREGQAITPASPPQALHELRKRCKELRYLIEVFGSLRDRAEQARAISELKTLQDCLGEFQDTDVQLAELRVFASAMMADRSAPAETLLAMGEIAGALAVRQAAARQEFDRLFAGFCDPHGRAGIEALAKARS
jgi:CHAD domain-containing protein